MPSTTVGQTPSLSTFLKSLKHNDIESSIELFVSLLQRRQIRNSRPCAIATTQLLLRVVANERTRDAQALIKRIRDVGRRLVVAQPREMAVGNIVRRVLGVVREVAEEDQDSASLSEIASPTAGQQAQSTPLRRPDLTSNISSFSPLHHGAALPQDLHARRTSLSSSGESTPMVQSTAELPPLDTRPALNTATSSYAGAPPNITSLFGLFQHPNSSPTSTPGTQSPAQNSISPTRPTATKAPPGTTNPRNPSQNLDIKAEAISGLRDLLDELSVVDTQIAESALDHIHSNEVILTHTSSSTIQKFLATAARKRKFTLIHAEAYPNDHHSTHATILNGGRSMPDVDDDTEERWKPLTALGITVILIPDSAIFALMSRINKVLLAPHAVLANGSLIACAGSATLALAARAHSVPVVVLSGVYKLSPVYPFDTDELIEAGDPGKAIGFEEGEFVDGVDVRNPVFDHVSADLVSLYITNLGGCAPSFLYRIVADHYRVEDVDLMARGL